MSIQSGIYTVVLGVLFGLGLTISGMTDPSKVQGFLSPFYQWDISLMFVMIGALAVTTPAYFFIFKRKTPTHDDSFHVPSYSAIDKNLVIGSAFFGVGWALAGYCPAPVIASLASFQTNIFLFLAAMFVGNSLHKIIAKRFTAINC